MVEGIEPSQGPGVETHPAPMALEVVAKQLKALMGIRRMCVQVLRQTKHEPRETAVPGAKRGKRGSVRVPTDKYHLSLFEGGSVDGISQSDAQSLEHDLNVEVAAAILPIRRKLVEELYVHSNKDVTLTRGKLMGELIHVISGLNQFRFHARPTSGAVWQVVAGGSPSVLLIGTEEEMKLTEDTLNRAIEKRLEGIVKSMTNQLHEACDNLLEATE